MDNGSKHILQQNEPGLEEETEIARPASESNGDAIIREPDIHVQEDSLQDDKNPSYETEETREIEKDD